MALIAPELDDRKFQDLVDECKRLIPRYCPEWTDHNVSDPGVTLIELFAWMTEILLYRLNKVTDRNYVKFLDLIGVRPLPAGPAHADVSFWLSAPQPEPVVIPRGTEVATVRTESREAITFVTEADLRIDVPGLAHVLVSRAAPPQALGGQGAPASPPLPRGGEGGSGTFHDYMPALRNPDLRLPLFQDPPQENDSLYLGFAQNLSAHMLALQLRCEIEGIGVDPRDPPLVWECWDSVAEEWVALHLERDTTGGLNRTGEVVIHAPYEFGQREIDGHYAAWIRCRAARPRPNQRPYSASPRLFGLEVAAIGGMAPASHAARIGTEILGRSDGLPDQRFRLQYTPVLPRREEEALEVADDAGAFEAWSEVEDFSASGLAEQHYTLDSDSGEIRFGPCIRQPDGTERQYGMIPPGGKQIRFTAYRTGGGIIGNVGQGTLNVLKSSIPYVARVSNRHPAIGGADLESLESAKLRGPKVLKTRTRAVTAEDFELLAQEASSAVARVRCLFPSEVGDEQGPPPGTVQLLILPRVTREEEHVPPEELEIPDYLRSGVMAYLDERRLLTTRLSVAPFPLQWVEVEVKAKARPRTDHNQLRQEMERRLYRFIHPVHGGPEYRGWPFERELFVGDVFFLFHGLKGLDAVEEVQLFPVDIATGTRGPASQRIPPPENGLLCSAVHRILL